VIFEVADFAQHAILLCFRDPGFQTKCKHVNEHCCGISRLKRIYRFLVTAFTGVNKNERCKLWEREKAMGERKK